jgi:alkylated DNA repair dioxygenase AlkB
MTRSLFAVEVDPTRNLLPHDGEVYDHGVVVDDVLSRRVMNDLQTGVPWARDEVVLFGKTIVTAREVAWFGDDGANYRYSGATKAPLAWTPLLSTLKALVEARTGVVFNSCLANRYHSGDEGMGWHSDDEPALGRTTTIASLSFGASRRFDLRHKRGGDDVQIVLEHGQLLVMAGETQQHWKHQLPKQKRVRDERINLTFRVIQTVPD